MRATEGWQDEAVRITAILFDGLRFGAGHGDSTSTGTELRRQERDITIINRYDRALTSHT
jgi:hypothetical protein